MIDRTKVRMRVVYEQKMIELHPRELALLLALRKYAFGEVTVIMSDGVPQRIRRVEVIEDLDKDLTHIPSGI